MDFAFPCAQLELTLTELFFLRTFVYNRLEDLGKTRKENNDNSFIQDRMDEAISLYSPLYKKLNAEIERRTKR